MERRVFNIEFNELMKVIEKDYEGRNKPEIEETKLNPIKSTKLSQHNKPEKEFKVCADSVFRLRAVE